MSETFSAAGREAADSGAAQRVAPTVIVDLGVGNLGNLERAVHALGYDAVITADPELVRRARVILLPGVGAFRPPREALRGALEDGLRAALDDGAWLLGICVGFQLLFEGSEEFGSTDGLGLLHGRIERLPDGVSLPHIGWNALHFDHPHPLLGGLETGAHAYFVHSFAPAETSPEEVVATCLHGREFPAIVGRARVFGTQFHPEKSGHEVGLVVLGNFLRLAGAPTSGDRVAQPADGSAED